MFLQLELEVLFPTFRPLLTCLRLHLPIGPLFDLVLHFLDYDRSLLLGVLLLDFLENLEPFLAFLTITIEQESPVPALEGVNLSFLEQMVE